MKKQNISEMKGSWPDPEKVACKDCIYRNRDTIELGKKIIKCGVVDSFCEMYPGPPTDNGKPLEILFQNASCKFYEKDDDS